MKKILAIFEEMSFNDQAVSSIIQVAKGTKSLIHGFALNDADSVESMQYPFPNDLSLTESEFEKEKSDTDDLQLLKDKLHLYKTDFEEAGIQLDISQDRESPIKKLIAESAFSDLILFLANKRPDDDNLMLLLSRSLEELLEKAYCPVLLIRGDSAPVEKNIFIYDNSLDAMNAIKLYSYIFPESRNLPTLLLNLMNPKDEEIENERYLHEWLAQHFTNLQTEIIQENVSQKLTQLLKQQAQNVVVITHTSNEYLSKNKRNFVELLMNEISASIFMT